MSAVARARSLPVASDDAGASADDKRRRMTSAVRVGCVWLIPGEWLAAFLDELGTP